MTTEGASSRRRKPKEKLNLFGQIYYQLCDRLGITGTALALRAGIDPGTISKATHEESYGRQTTKIVRKTVEKLYLAMRQVASERGIDWDDSLIWPHFERVAGYSTEQDQQASFTALVDFLGTDQEEERRPPT